MAQAGCDRRKVVLQAGRGRVWLLQAGCDRRKVAQAGRGREWGGRRKVVQDHGQTLSEEVRQSPLGLRLEYQVALEAALTVNLVLVEGQVCSSAAEHQAEAEGCQLPCFRVEHLASLAAQVSSATAGAHQVEVRGVAQASILQRRPQVELVAMRHVPSLPRQRDGGCQAVPSSLHCGQALVVKAFAASGQALLALVLLQMPYCLWPSKSGALLSRACLHALLHLALRTPRL